MTSSIVQGPISVVLQTAKALGDKYARDHSADSYMQLYSYLYDCDVQRVCWFETLDGRRCDHISMDAVLQAIDSRDSRVLSVVDSFRHPPRL